jgi:hypothetical protein
MRECKHESVTGYMWRPRMIGRGQIMEWSYAFAQPGRADHHHRMICDDCGAWLPLGPAAPHTEQTRIELRAAELAADWDDDEITGGFLGLGMASPDGQHDPLLVADIAAGNRSKWPRDLNDYLAGHLARCIIEHDKEQP